jgi:hypothetical protein
LTNIISLSICASCFKLAKIRSLKQGTYFLAALLLYEIVWAILINQYYKLNVDDLLNLDVPIKL